MLVEVFLALAMICFGADGQRECHNALVGPSTPVGEYQIVQRLTESLGYGGDVLQFKETDEMVYAIHRVWLLRPEEHRERRIKSRDPRQRSSITNGCINVEPAVYEALLNCCSNSTLVVK